MFNTLETYAKQFYPYNGHGKGKWTTMILVNESVPLSVISWYKRKLGIDVEHSRRSTQSESIIMDMCLLKHTELKSEVRLICVNSYLSS